MLRNLLISQGCWSGSALFLLLDRDVNQASANCTGPAGACPRPSAPRSSKQLKESGETEAWTWAGSGLSRPAACLVPGRILAALRWKQTSRDAAGSRLPSSRPPQTWSAGWVVASGLLAGARDFPKAESLRAWLCAVEGSRLWRTQNTRPPVPGRSLSEARGCGVLRRLRALPCGPGLRGRILLSGTLLPWVP